MTDPAGSMPPFPGFPGFPPAEMLDRMWGMMRLTPFGSAFPGGEPGVAQGFGPSLSMMSDMMTPLTNIEELDKRITDLRAVEQWLKLNLSMLQSAIQAFEVQRATLSTLRAFGAFAQAQMSPSSADTGAAAGAARERTAEPGAGAGAANAGEASDGPAAAPPGFDAASWWNLVQAQFNQLAQFAMAQPAAAAQAAQAAANAMGEAQTQTGSATAKRSSTRRSSGTPGSANNGGNSSGNSSAGNGGSGAGRSAPRGAKKAPAQPE